MEKTTQNQSKHKLWVKNIGVASIYALERGQIIYCGGCDIIFQSDSSIVYREEYKREGRFLSFWCMNCVRGLTDDSVTETKIVTVMDNIKVSNGWRPVIPMKPALMNTPDAEPLVKPWTTNYTPSRNTGHPMNTLEGVQIGSVENVKEVLLEDNRQENFTEEQGLEYLDMLKDSSLAIAPNDIAVVPNLEHWDNKIVLEDRRADVIVPGFETVEQLEAEDKKKKELLK